MSTSKIDFMGIHKITFSLSALLSIGAILLVIFRGLNFGIDFSGGILIEAKFQEATELSKVREMLHKPEIGEVTLQNFDDRNFMIKVSKSKNTDQNETIRTIKTILNSNFSNIEYRKVDFVGPQIGAELIKNAVLALFSSFLLIMIYIWIRFDWQFGLGAIIAVCHDAIMILGVFSALGLEFNSTSVAAILTIIGYSINDSVVIYDRIRENLKKFKKMNLSELLNVSINSTLSRTVLTASATLASLTALIVFGGDTLKSFSVSVFIGIIIGTYSSVYISAPILIYIDPRRSESKDKAKEKHHHKEVKKTDK